MRLLERFQHLLDAGNLRIHNVIRQKHCKWLIADKPFRLKYSMAKAQRLGLTHIADLGQLRYGTSHFQQRRLALRHKRGLKLRGGIEVVLHRCFPPARNNDDFVTASCYGLFNTVLNQGFVDQYEHFFRHRLGGRKKTGAHSCSWKNCLSNLHESHRDASAPLLFLLYSL